MAALLGDKPVRGDERCLLRKLEGFVTAVVAACCIGTLFPLLLTALTPLPTEPAELRLAERRRPPGLEHGEPAKGDFGRPAAPPLP